MIDELKELCSKQVYTIKIPVESWIPPAQTVPFDIMLVDDYMHMHIVAEDEDELNHILLRYWK